MTIQGVRIRKVRGRDGEVTFRRVIEDERGNVVGIADEPFFASGKTVGDLFRDIEQQVEAYSLETIAEADVAPVRDRGKG